MISIAAKVTYSMFFPCKTDDYPYNGNGNPLKKKGVNYLQKITENYRVLLRLLEDPCPSTGGFVHYSWSWCENLFTKRIGYRLCATQLTQWHIYDLIYADPH